MNKEKILLVSDPELRSSIRDILPERVQTRFDVEEVFTLDEAAKLLQERRYLIKRAVVFAEHQGLLRSLPEELSFYGFVVVDNKLVPRFKRAGDASPIIVPDDEVPEDIELMKQMPEITEKYHTSPYKVVVLDETARGPFAYGGLAIKALAEIARVQTIAIRTSTVRHQELHRIERGGSTTICFTNEQMLNGHGPGLVRNIFSI